MDQRVRQGAAGRRRVAVGFGSNAVVRPSARPAAAFAVVVRFARREILRVTKNAAPRDDPGPPLLGEIDERRVRRVRVHAADAAAEVVPGSAAPRAGSE